MKKHSDDICPRPPALPPSTTTPQSAGIFPASVWQCASPEEALSLLTGESAGYVYQRDGHPNADMLAAKLSELHSAQRTMITSSGMAAMSAVALSQLESGDHVIVSDQLYGRTLDLFVGQLPRMGVTTSAFDTCDLDAVNATVSNKTKLIVVETISNPLLRVADVEALANIAHEAGAKLVVDNTFASPVLCRPLERGADIVVESISKSINGHSDVMLGSVSCQETDWTNIPSMVSIWGLHSSPFDCWLAARGLMTLHLRAKAASENALQVAEFLSKQTDTVANVRYPGLTSHPDHELAKTQFGGLSGAIVTFDLAGGLPAAETFITAIAKEIPFAPSLGEVSTTLSHPASTSHRNQTPDQQAALGITGGTIRLSVGTESAEAITGSLKRALSG